MQRELSSKRELSSQNIVYKTTKYNNHSQSFKNRKNIKKIKLSGWIWQLNGNHIAFNLEWEIVAYTFA